MKFDYHPYFYGQALSPLDGNVRDVDRLIALDFLFDVLKPKPSPFRLVRVGGDRDGSYILPDDLSGVEACFSPGVNNFKHFEDQLSREYRMQCHLCDGSSDLDLFETPLIPGLQTFKKKWLAPSSNELSISLEEWIDEMCASPDSDLLLQMDIEGAEYAILESIDHEVLRRFRVLVLEFHGLHRAIYEPSVLFQICIPLFEKISRDYVCVHAHPNNCIPYGHPIPGKQACLYELIELTFLRRDRFMLVPQSRYHAVNLPHPLDIVNFPSSPLLFLEPEWSSRRTLVGLMTMLRQRISYWSSRFRKN